MSTNKTFSQLYGYFEITAQMPSAPGSKSGFWLLPENNGWPPELNVVEMSADRPTTLITTARTSTPSATPGQAISTVPDMTAAAHTYAVDWEADTITWYFDGAQVRQITTPADMTSPMYMLIDIYSGSPQPSGNGSAQIAVQSVKAWTANPYQSSTATVVAAAPPASVQPAAATPPGPATTPAPAPPTVSTASTTTACGATSGGAASGGFTTSNGQIIGPNGQPFVARGVDVMEGNQPSAAQLQADFPGVNFVRLAIFDYASPAALSAYVNSLTSAGIMVELENHNNGAGNAGGGQGTIFTGSALAQEQAWYAPVASAFAGNPAVWFGTNNEPSEINPATGQTDPAALSAWQQTTYNTIRAAGNNAPIMLEANSAGPGQTNVGYAASDYAGMTNVVWDLHYYGWVSGYSTNQATVTSTLSSMISGTQAIQSANGKIPVLIGEYGNSTSGTSIDANANQVITAVQQSGVGSAAWAWGTGNPGDGLTNGDGSASAYGQQVAAFTSGATACQN